MEPMAEDIPSSSSPWQPPDESFTKVILKEGSGLVKPNEGSTCIVQVDSLAGPYHVGESITGYPLQKEVEICVGDFDADLSELFDVCFESMKSGEICQLDIPESTLLKHLGDNFKDIKPDTITDVDEKHELVAKFKLELKSFIRVKEIWKLSADDKIERAEHQKMKGTACFQSGHITAAARRYSKALKFLITVGNKRDQEDLSESMRDKYNTMKCSCLLNLSACVLKMKQFDKVVSLCSDALNINANNVKGLYRRGQALSRLNEFDRAKEDFEKALKLEPQNKAVKDEMVALSRRRKQQDEKYAKAMSKMFGGPVKE
ncbi:uncharacterized protein LOC144440676 [Glandiceps talaboti]